MKNVHYTNGCKIALTKLGFDANALKALLMRSGLGMGAGAAAGGVIDNDNPLRGAALGAAGGLAGHGVVDHLMKKLPGSELSRLATSPLTGALGGAAAASGGRLLRED